MPLADCGSFGCTCDPKHVVAVEKHLPIHSGYAGTVFVRPHSDNDEWELLLRVGRVTDVCLCPKRPRAVFGRVFSDSLRYCNPVCSAAVDRLRFPFGNLINHRPADCWLHCFLLSSSKGLKYVIPLFNIPLH